jgi:hypothetical protein
MGAARFLDDTGFVPGVTSANRLITAALDAKLTELERDPNHLKPFHDPRRHLPAGATEVRPTGTIRQAGGDFRVSGPRIYL